MPVKRLSSAAARAREWRVQTSIYGRYERGAARALRRVFREAREEAAAGYAAMGPRALDVVGRDLETRVTQIMLAKKRAAATSMGTRVLRQFLSTRAAGRAPDTKQTPPPPDPAYTRFESRLDSWLARYGAARVRDVAETTRQSIRAAARDAAAEGLGQDAVARAIRAAGVTDRVRSQVIARTEIHQASMASQDLALRALDLPEVRREWVAAHDDRTRDSHRAADGQIRGQDEPFEVGDARLMYPGDVNGPPEEIIGCRCVVAPVVPDEQPTTDSDVPEGEVAAPPTPSAPPPRLGVESTEAERDAFVADQPPKFTAGDRTAGLDVLTQGRVAEATKQEFGHLVAADGKTVMRVTGERSHIAFTPELEAALDSGNGKVFHHNHPSSGSLSEADLLTTATYKGLSRVVAWGHNGSVYDAAVIVERSALEKAIGAIRTTDLSDVFYPADVSGLATIKDIESVYWHVRNLILRDAGLVDYRFALTAEQRSVMRDVLSLRTARSTYVKLVERARRAAGIG